MKNAFYALLLSLINFPIWADEVVCPEKNLSNKIYDSKIYDKSFVALEEEKTDENFPLQLILYKRKNEKNCERKIIYKYSFEGSPPTVKTLFFLKIKNKFNLITLSTWNINNRGDGTYGVLYQINAFETDEKNELKENPWFKKNNAMTGIDGYSAGIPSKFTAKTAADIKKLILSKHK